MSAQDPELSAALGWPGGISDPVLDRTRLLQMAAALRLASQQALEVLRRATPADSAQAREQLAALAALSAAVAQQAEPVQPGAWVAFKDGRLIYDYDFTHDVSLRVMGDFEDDEQRVRYAKQIVDKLNAAPAQQAVAAAELLRQHGEIESMRAERLRSERRLLDVKAQRDALLEALKTYGWHTEDCPQYPTYARPKNWPACTCGYDAAIALIEGRVKAVEEGK